MLLLMSDIGSSKVSPPPEGIEVSGSGGVDTARVSVSGAYVTNFGSPRDAEFVWEEPSALQEQWLMENGFTYDQVKGDSVRTKLMHAMGADRTTSGDIPIWGNRIYVRQSD